MLTGAFDNNVLKLHITLVTNGQLSPVASLNYSVQQLGACQIKISLHAPKTQNLEGLLCAANLKMQTRALCDLGVIGKNYVIISYNEWNVTLFKM